MDFNPIYLLTLLPYTIVTTTALVLTRGKVFSNELQNHNHLVAALICVFVEAPYTVGKAAITYLRR